MLTLKGKGWGTTADSEDSEEFREAKSSRHTSDAPSIRISGFPNKGPDLDIMTCLC